ESVLVAAEARFRSGGREQVARIQRFVTEEFEQRALEAVQTCLLVHHDDAAIGTAVFGRGTVGFDAKLLDCINDRIESYLAGLRLEHADTVIDVLAHARPASIDAGQETTRR